ncbi:MAG: hypothetical protein ACD_15C00135G0003 [uncultured bacterium]|nr:MAG: hypothetical protein ACD_15C00135G0003 [uncultured bacterium]OGN56967.1 MAG: hypothetical protein A2796_06580 [Chlamydiae bacterium RIFCSPHIGHO2_01_FULL_44_39]OGN58387.1 MAG: hypothetical protein A3C42_04485 [Chlamydiae bacterium RIFCSPHIGHO2_02_FULL_45_9]OGN59660.1 MAG: hypothetical protein A3D96_06455 [Chlamydiae bacterium RIFCSPHIGHO2_12_FULL_44_59]OGN65750.1 MAG: hypothetical protein A2978_07450 [Chlamydiae bacterium RIFCSPLOWO2_01_FULL_44_52]OGN67893.1 MAG: hypothetical protein A3
MLNNKILKYCLIAPSGSGKSTVAKLICNAFEENDVRCEILKIAQPLYEIQKIYYRFAQIKIKRDQQNNYLMETIANNLRKLNPSSLIECFLKRYTLINAPVVINDDLRDIEIDWPVLINLNFKMVFISTSVNIRKFRLSKRGDFSVSATSELDVNFLKMKPEIILENNEGLGELQRKVRAMIAEDVRHAADTLQIFEKRTVNDSSIW